MIILCSLNSAVCFDWSLHGWIQVSISQTWWCQMRGTLDLHISDQASLATSLTSCRKPAIESTASIQASCGPGEWFNAVMGCTWWRLGSASLRGQNRQSFCHKFKRSWIDSLLGLSCYPQALDTKHRHGGLNQLGCLKRLQHPWPPWRRQITRSTAGLQHRLQRLSWSIHGGFGLQHELGNGL